MTLVISLHSCQSNCELGNEVMNFMPNFIENLRSSLPVKFTPFGVVGMFVQNFLRHCGYKIQREIHSFVSKFMI